MASNFSKREEEEIRYMNYLKEEYEKGIMLQTAKDEGKEEKLIENIKTMSSNGFDNETIAIALSLDLNYVNEVLKK